MAEQWIPASTTLSDVLATHRRRLDELTRQLRALDVAVRLIEDQQGKERAHRRACDCIDALGTEVFAIFLEDEGSSGVL